jgi:hypothetical protein
MVIALMRSRALVATIVASSLLATVTVSFPQRASAAGCSTVTADGRCGMDLQRAWKHFTRGDPSVVISYIEGGINWHLVDSNGHNVAKSFANRIYVNWRETPVPCGAKHASACHRVYSSNRAAYDTNHDGFVNAADWKNDPRVHDSNHNGFIDAEDLIVAFSDGKDHDHNGYPSDISGWDFYDNQNDPATYDATYSHSDDQMAVLHHECPRCMIMPIKAGAEALDRTEDLAQAWLYSVDAGVSVITSVTADLGYSSFMRQAVWYAQRHGVAMVEASNDFDTPDHQGGMFWPEVLPGNGVVKDSSGDGWIRSDYTSWGPHNVFSVPCDGTTSSCTPTLAGVVGLLLSWGRVAARRGLISRPLTGPEAEQVMRATARRVTDPSLAWPGSRGEWNEQYGYGIPELYDAMKQVAAGAIPTAAWIRSPRWYQLVDPKRTKTLAVTGTIEPSRAQEWWRLDVGVGPQPNRQQWTPISIAGVPHRGSFSGQLGTIPLDLIPKSFWSRPFQLSGTKFEETTERYTVTIRLRVTDHGRVVSEDRRAIDVVHDPSWLPHFPRPIGASGESQPALVGLEGGLPHDIVFGDANGFVHAIDPYTGKEVPGWPVHTRPVHVVRRHRGVDPGYEPIVGDVAVGDLSGNGREIVVATSLEGRVYAWGPNGHLQPGWPILMHKGVHAPAIPRPALQYTRLPTTGAVAGPVLYDIGGTSHLEIIQVGWDGNIHVWEPDGSKYPGWPVKVTAPSPSQIDPGAVLVHDQKLDTPPAIAYLNGQSQPPDIVVRPQYTETQPGGNLSPEAAGFLDAYAPDGSLLPGFPMKLPGTVEYYGSAQEFITEGDAAPSAADVTGSGSSPDMVAVGPVFTPPYLIGASGIVASYGTAPSFPPSPGSDVPVPFTTSGAFGKVDGAMTFAQQETGSTSLANSLLQPNSGGAITEYMVAYPATGGSARPGYPQQQQGIPFLSEPIFVDVTGDGNPEVVGGGDANAIVAFTDTGSMASGFPKWTTGWTLFSPTAGDILGGGLVELVTATREGYVMVWRTNGVPSGSEWWRGGHDEWNTGRWGTVITP